METLSIENIIESLSSKRKLDRDKSLNNLLSSIPNFEQGFLDCLLSSFISLLKKSDSERSWESYHGILQATKALISLDKTTPIDDIHIKEIRDAASGLLTHPEVRVRQAAGEVLGSLCSKDNGHTYVEIKSDLLQLIKSNLERQPLQLGSSIEIEPYETSKIVEKLNYDSGEMKSASQVFHDTAGWRNLETSMICLEHIIKGCNDKFLPFINQELLELLFTTLTHTNRFVRETGYTVCAELVSCGMAEGIDPLQGNPMIIYGDQLAKHLSEGLADNWSQVRLAASQATRKFLMTLPTAARERFFPVLLPRICLNRYYVAEGVRLYSQETWKQVTGSQGRMLVEKYIDHVVPYYIKATEAENHAVREAACACVAELALKIPKEAVKPHVVVLLHALKVCFGDDSWPVRDAACVACGNFIVCFPEEASSEMEVLFPLFFNNLQDNIPSVRQGAAGALHNIIKVYEKTAFPRLKELIITSLKCVESQPSETVKYSDLDLGPATYGVVKQKRDNDLDLHTNRQMYSCGSLAPKMGRGKGGGCSNASFHRPSQPWEKADGCLFLMAELSCVPSLARDIAQMLPLAAKATAFRHYTAHLTLLETLCKVLPAIAKGLGKKTFKPHLYLFFDHIFYALESESDLCSTAANQCLKELSMFLGPNILRGRVDEYNPSYLSILDSVSLAP